MTTDEHSAAGQVGSIFVGRERELQLVDDALASATQGNASKSPGRRLR